MRHTLRSDIVEVLAENDVQPEPELVSDILSVVREYRGMTILEAAVIACMFLALGILALTAVGTRSSA